MARLTIIWGFIGNYANWPEFCLIDDSKPMEQALKEDLRAIAPLA